ncbi:DUF1697 domain-containing protein [uncultured Microbacterium sp.]|uniref:DUF1697 domain-containing protein n=1 Tax=uncultured Microbacterium sp. TaxID=191216 RepID=UPI0026256D98|nr:DUF1697 domain-containing protein [uncultured Microbacterium sp.]
MSRSVLLLRAVNVSGRNLVPMAKLRAVLGVESGLTGVSTYIASGNIICDSPADATAACARVREVIEREFDVDTPVIARTHEELVASESTSPFRDGGEKSVHAMFLESVAAEGASGALEGRLLAGERIALIGRDLWIDYGDGGVGRTKLTKAVLDGALRTPGTARNLRTVRTLIELTA